MAKIPSFPLYAQDFDMDTNTWTNEEIGVYLRLLMSEWINGHLPNDFQKLAKIARISPKKFSNLFQNIQHKFTLNGNGFLINKKMEEVRTQVNNYVELKKKAGKKGAKIRWGNDNTTNGDAIAQPMANGMPNQWPSSSMSSSNKNVLLDTPNGVSSPVETGDQLNQSKIPRCPQEKIKSLYHEILCPPMPPVNEWSPELEKILRNMWRDNPDRWNLDWWEDYFKFVKLSDFLTGRVNDFIADLEWIIRPRNRTKILNGRYHNKGSPELKKYSGILNWLEGGENNEQSER